MTELTVIDCRPDAARPAAGGPAGHPVGPRPGKAIDPLLAGRILVLGDDGDLAAVVLRLLRRELLGTVEVAYAPTAATPVTRLWRLPVGVAARAGAAIAPAGPVVLVRDDVGGVLVGSASLAVTSSTVYVDEHRVLGQGSATLQVRPDPARGLTVTLTGPRRLGLLPGRRTTVHGRAVQIGTAPTTVTSDGVPYPRPMDRWTFYRHTEPLLLVGVGGPGRAG